MPPKKHAEKHAAKHAKKHAAKHAKNHIPKHEGPKHLRRAYEHLGRVEAIRQVTASTSLKSVQDLVLLAKTCLEDQLPREAADLLRAAEHLVFSALPANSDADRDLDQHLLQAIADEFDKLSSRAGEHWAEHKDHAPDLTRIFDSMAAAAKQAFDGRKYRQALELARGAEALAHVRPKHLGKASRQLATKAAGK